MSEFIVHTIPGSPFARAVLATLEEKGASYRLAPVMPGTMRSPCPMASYTSTTNPIRASLMQRAWISGYALPGSR